MALTNPTSIIDTTFSSVNISSAASVYAYTAAASGIVHFNVKLTNAAGNGDYVVYLTKQWGGTGTASVMHPKTTATVASGETVIEFATIPVYVKAADVVNVMIDGLAGDTAVNGNIQIVKQNFSLFDASADTVTAGAISANAVTASALATDAVTEITGGILNATASSYDTAGTIGEAINNAGGGSVTVNSYVAVSAAVAASVSSGRLALQPYATFRQAITSTSTLDLSSAAKLWLAVKPKGALDAESIIFIEKTAGLTVLAGTNYGTAAHGSLTVSGSSGAWSVAVYIDEIATSLLASYDGQSVAAELKVQSGTDDTILWTGLCDFSNGLIITL